MIDPEIILEEDFWMSQLNHLMRLFNHCVHAKGNDAKWLEEL